jgi:hypothetical protein
MMAPEELLIPRYKVIGPYPFSPYNVGDIISTDPPLKTFIAAQTERYSLFMPIKRMEDMPNLFRLMEWHEERKIEEMPEYVKVTREDCVKDTGLYCKVYKWSVFDEKFPSVAGHFGAELEGYTPLYLARTELNFPGQIYGRLNAMNLQPATREEYEQYNKQKEVNNG